MVSYCFIYVCEKIWWIYILKKGSDKMNELMHFGIKGQKWGVRRYKNADGTLTTAGKKRISKDSKIYKDKYKKTADAVKDYYDDLRKQNSYKNPQTGNRIQIYNYKKREKS